MTPRLFLWALLSLVPAVALADGSAPSIPHTPAGRALGTWLAVFNAGERTGIESFIKEQASWLNLDSVMRWRAEVGGYDLLAIYTSDRTAIAFGLRPKIGRDEEVGKIAVSATDPRLVTELGTFIIPPGATFVGFGVDGATRKSVVNASIAQLAEHYVFPDVGKAMAIEIAKRAKQGAYSVADGESLASLLTADMRGISHDKHLQVTFKPFRMPAAVPNKESGGTQTEAKNCAFDKVERMPNNVGYIKFDAFVGSDVCADVRTASMDFLAGIDALIFDLRDNHGGGGSDKGPDLLSYLFEQPTHLSDFWDRKTGRTTQDWIQPVAPEKRLARIPVYVLTSRMTFSAAEYFAYNLQAFKRATIVGEVTGGGAHLTSTERIDDRFTIRVPYGRPMNTITQTNWEGVGVIPDVKVPAAEALAVAEKLASAELQKRSN
jgi:retinol-binding protein 3